MPGDPVTFVEHEGHRIACIAHIHSHPDRLPLIWIHGLAMSVRFWEEGMYAEITDHRSWYSISLPLHHPSTFDGKRKTDTLDENLFAELLAKAIDHWVPEGRFHLVGHSLGGFAALNYAAKNPARVASIVSIGGFMTGRAKGLEGALQFLSKGNLARKLLFFTAFRILQSHVFFLRLASFACARDWWSLVRFRSFNRTLRRVFPDIRLHSVAEQRSLCRYLIDMNLLDELDSIQHPVLVMAGEKDPIIPVDHQIEYATRLSHGHLVLFSGAGHLVFAEAPRLFEKTLLDWLDRQG